MTGIKTFDYSIDALRPLQWKENAAANLRALMDRKQTWIDTNQTQFWENFERDIFDLRTANDFGLEVWSIILDFPTFFNAGTTLFSNTWGFGQYYGNFDNANFNPAFSSGSEDQALTTEQLRLGLRLRFYQLHMDGSITQTNAMLKDLFGHLGVAYIRDNLDMTITFVFNFALDADLLLVVEQDQIMPIPPGVLATVEVNAPNPSVINDTEWVASSTLPTSWTDNVHAEYQEAQSNESSNLRTVLGTGYPGHIAESFTVTIHTLASGGVSDEIEIKAFTSGLNTIGPLSIIPNGAGPDVGGGRKSYSITFDMSATTGNLNKIDFQQTGNISAFTVYSLIYV